MSIKIFKTVKYLPVALGTSGLIVLAVTGICNGMTAGNAGSVMASNSHDTNPPPSYVDPHVGQMQVGQTAGEEPTDLATTTTVALPSPKAG